MYVDLPTKTENIRRIKEIANCPVGVGDNDAHELSDSDCCCGLDTVGPKFDNWLKYNYTYWLKHKDLDVWSPSDMNVRTFGRGNLPIWKPENSCGHIFNSSCQKEELKTVKDYVDLYIRDAQRGRLGKTAKANQLGLNLYE
jgi:hypothetical protein